MKVVVDTNVVISGIFFAGPPHTILNAWHSRTLTLVVSPAILDEYSRVAHELSESFPDIDIFAILHLIYSHTMLVNPAPLDEPVCSDPDDDKFIAAALTGKALIIISGDKHLHAVSGYKGISVFSPRAFVQNYLH